MLPETEGQEREERNEEVAIFSLSTRRQDLY